jgi:transcriptional regulator with XRE-family HTH domain
MNVGKKFRTLREAKGVSLADIEKRSGLSRSYVSRVENGHTVPSLSTLEKFAKAIEVEPYQLLFKQPKPPKKFGPTLITTPFPSAKRVARVFGISKERMERISRWVEGIQKSNGKLRPAG